MAKGQTRGNRETRKPKAVKPTAAAAPPVLLAKGATDPTGLPKRKK